MTKRIYFDFEFSGYPKKDIYSLTYKLGKELAEYLGKEKVKLLLDSHCLHLNSSSEFYYISDKSYKLHPAAKALEGFLEKLIKNKSLKQDSEDRIGHVFWKKDNIVQKKIKDRRLIARTKMIWDYCRNDIMHYSENQAYRETKSFQLYNDIVELIIDLYKDFYGKTEPDELIIKGWREYC